MLLELVAALAASQGAAPPAPDYARDEAWLCLPGRADACGQVLPTVALGPDGYGAVAEARPAADAAADCFYVYPTVSRDPGTNSDMDAGQDEIAAAYAQAARFASVCRLHAPVYRQLTLTALMAAQAGGEGQAALGRGFALAYADVRAAWAQFLAARNGNRPFVLIGHSQGSIHLAQLLREEIEGEPVADRMLSAILLGWNIEVPEGAAVGGSFAATPLCTARGQLGCVVSYVSFARDAPPPEDATFGRAATPGRTVACTNPATLAAGRAPLDSYWHADRPQPRPIRWSREGAPPTPFVRTEGLAFGECVHDGPIGYLAIDVPPTPDDARTDRIPGAVGLPGWGLHLADVPVAHGDLIRLVAAQTEAWPERAGAARRR